MAIVDTQIKKAENVKRKLRPYLINDRKPSEWTGSVAILEEFMKSGGHRAVKYAQCWVYAGLVTTICRALGIPCRNVTNYISAHDTNKSMTGLVTGTILFLFMHNLLFAQFYA